MINVVFLMLVFFMMSSELAPRPPIDVVAPESPTGELTENGSTLFVAADGTITDGKNQGDAALESVAAAAESLPVQIRADAGLPAAELARIMSRLADRGVANVAIQVSLRAN